MTDDLIARLRATAEADAAYGYEARGGLFDEAADRIEALTAEVERLREALVAEREENLWSAYATGDVRGDEWTHLYMSDGEWLVRQCGLDPKQGYYKAEDIRNAIPIAARAALEGTSDE